MNPPGLTPAAAAQLQEGIDLVISRWAALRMAVENEWGGRDSLQKSQQLGQHLFLRLAHSKEQVYFEDMVEMLDEFMLSLNTEIEDGSIEEIAEKLMVMREECSEGNFESVKRLKETNAPKISYNIKASGDNSDDGDGDGDGDEDETSEMEVDATECESNLDQKGKSIGGPSLQNPAEVKNPDDGWTVVASRRRRRN